ncbi:uncharacterized protein LOC115974093 [Quercus lobata]|nr:uncharacterized protein LOC115974093 [Quercus lobata]
MELNRRQIIVSTNCVMCEQEDETLDHLFLKCPFARALWFGSPRNIRSDTIPSIRQWLISILEKYKAGNEQEDNVLTDISATLWVIWTYRNMVLFENKAVDIQQAISSTSYFMTEWKIELDEYLQIGSTPTETTGNQSTCRTQNWQAIIIVDIKKRSREAIWNGGAFVIKNRLGQSVRKGCYSWHSSNDETNLLSTIREALYEAWKQGFREVILFLQSNHGVKLIQTHCLTSLENVPLMEDIATLQKMFKHIHVQVAPLLVLQEVQGLADMATVCFTRLTWI